MAFYTPPLLPSSPSAMNAPLPLSSWSVWTNRGLDAPLTPPMTSTFQSRTMPQQKPRLTLPPISQLDRHLPPLTPPAEATFSKQRLSRSPVDDMSDSDDSEARPQPTTSQMVDWLDASRTRSSQSIAEKTCEMICYLWFASPPAEHAYPSPSNSPHFMSRSMPPSPLQLAVTPAFVQFMRKLLETTQVSQSVIVLSLHYIYRLREKNRFTPAQSGSEFRIAVAGLMMANKFLDDNTYTNKTWSEVSGIDLPEINKMEREFLLGVEFNLYVDKPTYESWLNLLKGLVLTKERDSRQYRTKSRARPSRAAHTHSSTGPATRTYTTSRTRAPSHRARSTSPSRQAVQQPCYHLPPPIYTQLPSPTPRSGSKRTAEAAFSPSSVSHSEIPSKRQPVSLQIPSSFGPDATAPRSYSPLESLQSFANMSIDSPQALQSSRNMRDRREQLVSESRGARGAAVPETLITAYSVDDARRAPPQQLYFYTLACSPMENDAESRWRKARLRVHHPPPSSADLLVPPSTSSASSASSSASCDYSHHYSHLPPLPQLPQLPNHDSRPRYLAPSVRLPYHPHPVVQSASTSPHEMHVNFASRNYGQQQRSDSLPHFNDTAWKRPPVVAAPGHHQTPSLPAHHSTTTGESPVPFAPFANAGPPGFHFYPTPMQRTYELYPPHVNWPLTASRSQRV
ncbi:Cyclin domain containing protein [Amanita muscaria]